jgi:SAM-dependent methyltransferase
MRELTRPPAWNAASGSRVNGVNEDERIERGASFGAVAAAYDEHRPDYPEAAVRWCLAPVRSGPDLSGLRVLDLGAGTGKLTTVLVRLGADVTAVDPDPEMLAELRQQLPAIRALAGTAESIPLPAGSVDAVLCGQSMHWFDLDTALPEIARVLADGGVVGGLWNNDDDRVEWVAGLQAAAQGAASPSLSARRAELAGFAVDQFAPDLFAPSERAEFPHGQRRTARSLVATIATHSKFLVMEPEERDRRLGQVSAYLAGRAETSAGEFTLPMVTIAVRAARRGTDVSPLPAGM